MWHAAPRQPSASNRCSHVALPWRGAEAAAHQQSGAGQAGCAWPASSRGGKQPHLGRREGVCYHGKNKTEHVAYWSAPSLPYDCTNCSSCVSERGAASPYCDGFVLIQVLYLLLSLHFILDGMYGFVQEAALQCCSAFSSSLLCQAQYSVVSFISMEKSRANPNLSSRPLS